MKKDLLLIVHRIPYPPDKGDKIRTYHMLNFLSKHFRVTVACMIDDLSDVKHVEALGKMVHQVHFQLRTKKSMKVRVIGSLLAGKPFTEYCFYSKKLQRAIDDYLERFDPTAILCFCSSTTEYLYRSRHGFSKLQQKVLLNDLIDVDSEKWAQYAEKHWGIMKWLYRREARLLLPREQLIIREFNRTFLVSEEEKRVLAAHGPVDKVEALSNGVDLEYFSPDKCSKELTLSDECKLVFSGAMDYWPNIEGATWFARKIFPTIKKAFPHATFCIAGRNPPEEVLALKTIPGIEVTGTVPDMRDYLATATICVVPLLIARGIQNKILEGMAMGKPVIATKGAATGIRAIDGQEIIVADDASQMAQAIIDLLGNKERLRQIGRRGRAYVEREHSWESHLSRMTEIIESKC